MRDLTMGAPGLSRAKSVADGFSDAVLADASPRLLAGLVLLALAASAGLALMPTYPIGAQLNDFFLLVDWIHRWGAGQVPHRDYHAPLGFLATAPAALGFAFTGDVGRALRLADIAALAALTGPFLVAARGRLSNGLATIAFAVVAALTLTPLDLFNLLPFPSAAMTYNRVGWAALLVAALFLVPARRPAERPTSALDLAMLAWLALLGLYLKATYGLALGAIGLLYLALHRPPARALLPAVVLALGGIGLIEAVFGLNRAYLVDLAFAAGVDGAGRMGPARVLFALTASGGDVLLGALVPVAVALAAGRRALAAAIAVLLALAVAVMLQNAQASGLPLLVAGAVIAAAVVDRAGWGRPARLLALALPLAAAAPTLELALRTWDGTARALAKPGALTGTALPGLRTLRVPGEPGFALVARAAAGGLDARTYVAEAARLAPTGAQNYRLADALAMLAAARDLVPACRLGGGSALMLDFADPLPAVAGLAPAGRMPVLHAWRSFSAARHPAADAVLAGVDCVLVPLLPLEASSTDLALALYGEAIRLRFPDRVETPFFTLYRRGAQRG